MMEGEKDKKKKKKVSVFSNQPNVKLSTQFGMAATQREDSSQQMWSDSVRWLAAKKLDDALELLLPLDTK